MAEWFEVEQDVLDIAEDLIDKYHGPLREARIAFIFRDVAQESGGRKVLGQASKISDKMKAILDYDFLIWISHEDWVTFPYKHRQALIDHELCHCKFDIAEGKASMRPHDIEEFQEIIDRHGFWSESLRAAVPAIEKSWQDSLFDLKRGKVMAAPVDITVQALG